MHIFNTAIVHRPDLGERRDEALSLRIMPFCGLARDETIATHFKPGTLQ
jgi:hypothetical protein